LARERRRKTFTRNSNLTQPNLGAGTTQKNFFAQRLARERRRKKLGRFFLRKALARERRRKKLSQIFLRETLARERRRKKLS